MEPESPAVQAPLSEMFDALDDAVVVIDRGLRLVYANDAFCALVGWPRPILIGAEPPMPWWVPGEADRALDLLRRLLDGAGIDGPSAERVYRHRTGREIPVGIRSSLLRDERGEVTALVAFARPLGEAGHEAVEEARRERHRLAREERSRHVAAQAGAALAEGLAAPAEDIRARADALAAELAGTPHEETLRVIIAAAGRIQETARELAEAWAPSADVSVDLGTVDLATLTMSGLAELGHDADRAGMRLRGDLVPSAVVRGDAARLRQVLETLVGSALRRAPEGTEVRVGVRCGGGWAVLEVEDRGPGLDEGGPEALFAALPADGDGIGPAAARAIARAHGGELDAVDVPAGGLVLRLTLPLAEDGPA